MSRDWSSVATEIIMTGAELVLTLRNGSEQRYPPGSLLRAQSAVGILALRRADGHVLYIPQGEVSSIIGVME